MAFVLVFGHRYSPVLQPSIFPLFVLIRVLANLVAIAAGDAELTSKEDALAIITRVETDHADLLAHVSYLDMVMNANIAKRTQLIHHLLCYRLILFAIMHTNMSALSTPWQLSLVVMILLKWLLPNSTAFPS
jgi:hypothetical protein